MLSMKEIIKKTLTYRFLYAPYMGAKRLKITKGRHEVLMREGVSLLRAFANCMNSVSIPYWLEFGTLLGAYRDGDFIQNDFDIDVGVYLKDAHKVYHTLLENGFKLLREFHVVGENGLEQTFEYHGLTIDVMYFYEDEGLYWCNGVATLPKTYDKVEQLRATAHWFKPFGTSTMDFKGLHVSIPDNVEEHLIEIFGTGFRKYDPHFPGDLNKIYYLEDEKKAIGFKMKLNTIKK